MSGSLTFAMFAGALCVRYTRRLYHGIYIAHISDVLRNTERSCESYRLEKVRIHTFVFRSLQFSQARVVLLARFKMIGLLKKKCANSGRSARREGEGNRPGVYGKVELHCPVRLQDSGVKRSG